MIHDWCRPAVQLPIERSEIRDRRFAGILPAQMNGCLPFGGALTLERRHNRGQFGDLVPGCHQYRAAG